MNPKRIRLINAARNAMFQRAQVQRSSLGAKTNFAPTALKQRAQANVTRRVDALVESAERGLRRYALPLGLAAVAGLAFAFRRPLADAAHAVADTLSEAAALVSDQIAALNSAEPPSPPDDKDEDHEPA